MFWVSVTNCTKVREKQLTFFEDWRKSEKRGLGFFVCLLLFFFYSPSSSSSFGRGEVVTWGNKVYLVGARQLVLVLIYKHVSLYL